MHYDGYSETGVHGKLAARKFFKNMFGEAKTGQDYSGGGGVRFPKRTTYFSVFRKSRPALRPTLPFNGYRGGSCLMSKTAGA